MTAQARNSREARKAPEKNKSGTAANIYKEMHESTKSSDEMTWKGSECLLIKRESIEGWMKQLAKLSDETERVITATSDL